MTHDEARAVAAIMMTADMGCSVCASRLLAPFLERFPEARAAVDEEWEKEYGGPFKGEVC